MTLKVLHWRITATLSAASLIFNFLWYLVVTHNSLQSAKLAASSLISLGFSHAVHRGADRWQRAQHAKVRDGA